MGVGGEGGFVGFSFLWKGNVAGGWIQRDPMQDKPKLGKACESH